jgi:glutamate carboxypeptidase
MLDRARRALKPRCDEAEPLLRRWVEQSSYTRSREDVDRMGRLLVQGLEPTGMQVLGRDGGDFGTHFGFFTPAWQGAARRTVLVGHHDTVFPPGTFEGYQREGDIARGPGVLDMKGGLVAVRTALCALADAELLDALPVALICVADEEVGSPDSASFTAEHARGAHAALVFEAGRAHDAIITRRKGTGALHIRVQGKAAHAGNFHADGVNAIWALARIVDQVQALTRYEQGVTVNVGTIRGGSSKNTVPADAECEVDFRFERAADGAAMAGQVESIARAVCAQLDAQVSVSGGVRRPPLERTQASAALFAKYAAAAQAAGLGGGEAGLLGGGSDANNVAALGVPAIDGLGPRGRGFHTHDEFIEVSSLSLRAQALVRFLCSA